MLRLCSHGLNRPKLLIGTLGILVAGCGGGSDSGTPPSTTTIAKASSNSGDAQAGPVGQPLAAPLQVVVTEDGAPSPNVSVTWTTTAGSLNPASTPTDANGVAISNWTLGTTAGAQTAQAALTGATGSPVSFSATAAADVATVLSKAGGDNQTGGTNAQLATLVQAKVADQFANGIPGVAVNWAASGAAVSAATVPTDASGISPVTVTLGGTAGPVTITATAGDLIGSPLTFNATATTAQPSTTVFVTNNSFSPQTVTIAAGTKVTWTWGSSAINHNVAPDATLPPRSGNPVNGPHTYEFTFNNPGTYLYHCEVHGAAGGIGMSGTITVQ
jgi:plastocyanin